MYAVGDGISQNLFHFCPPRFHIFWPESRFFLFFGLKPIFLRRSYITWQEKFSLWKLFCVTQTSP